MRSEQQLRTFLYTLNEFSGSTPLSKFFPNFFKRNKQMGSNDRRVVSRLLYNYFRLGKALQEHSPEQRVCVAEFLCNTTEPSFLNHFRPDLGEKLSLTVDEKIHFLKEKEGFNLEKVFPFIPHLSSSIDIEEFLKSFFIQPSLYIRIQNGYEEKIKTKLRDEKVSFSEIGQNTVALPNGTKLEQILEGIETYEIQDLSSQQTGTYFKPQKHDYWWDACAASGGKSLLLFSKQHDLKLLVSDIRESILHNLDERFRKAGLKNYHKKVIDLTQNISPFLHHFEFNGVLFDAPCSGSGTWARTPEMINQFEELKIQSFQNLQKKIASNILPYLKVGCPLVYITCSVFKEENEDIVDFLVHQHQLKLEGMQLLKGYEHKADTMFAARLLK